MKLKLVDSKPLSDEIIASLYKRIEQQTSNEDKQEDFQYNESGIITRRKFLKYSALGAIGLGLGLSTEKAEANPLLIPLAIMLFKELLHAGERANGHITIINQTKYYKSSQMKLRLVGSRRIQSNAEYANYDVPAFTENTYEIINGPKAYATQTTTHARLEASNWQGKERSSRFTIQA